MSKINAWLSLEDAKNVCVSPEEGEIQYIPLETIVDESIFDGMPPKLLRGWQRRFEFLAEKIEDHIETLATAAKEEKEFKEGIIEDMQDDSWETED